MSFSTAPLNVHEPMVDERRRPSKTFIDWVTNLVGDVDASPARLKRTSVSGQTAAISATPIPTEALSAGWYRVTVYARVTTAAGVSSSLTPTITHTDTGQTCTQSGTALTSNAIGTPASWTFLVYSDAASPISYSTAYASAGAPAMIYKLDVILEQLDA